MIEQATTIPHPLKFGPAFVSGTKVPGTGDNGTALNLYPRPDGVQHCELAGMHDTIDGYADRIPGWLGFLKGQLTRLNWPEEMRPITHDAPVHPSVRERFKLVSVVQCAGHGPYRPEALRQHDEFKTYYPPPA
jgi:hypothetical protein